jgi:hypothetical protein
MLGIHAAACRGSDEVQAASTAAGLLGDRTARLLPKRLEHCVQEVDFRPPPTSAGVSPSDAPLGDAADEGDVVGRELGQFAGQRASSRARLSCRWGRIWAVTSSSRT